MAKQNVTFIERHVEKIAVGVAGGVLLAMIWLFGINSPNKVAAGDQELGPEAFYRQIGELAREASTRIKGGQVKKPEPLPVLGSGPGQNVYASAGVPMNPLSPFLPPGLAVPLAQDPISVGNIELAKVLPPKALTVSEGRGTVLWTPPQLVSVAQNASADNTENAVPTDYAWALLVAALDRKAQRELFTAAGYAAIRQQLIVADVQAERQELLPNGQWGTPQLVRGYSPVIYTAEDRVEMIEQDNRPMISDPDRQFLSNYRTLLYSPEGQDRALRPEFQSLIDKAPLLWAPPHKLVGYDFDLKDFGVQFPAEGVKPGSRQPNQPTPRDQFVQRSPTRNQPQPGPMGNPDVQVRKKVDELRKEARAAVAKKEYIKASELLTQALQMVGQQGREAQEILKQLQSFEPQYNEQLREQEKLDKLKQNLNVQDLGKDQEPLWLTDLSVEPGKSYRYRLRLVAYNDYAGSFSMLKNPKDAERVLIYGEWSEWSEPVTITPMVQVFFTDARDSQKTGARVAHLQIHHFTHGKWDKDERDYEIGEQLSYKSGVQAVSYDAVVGSIEADRPYRARNKTTLAADAPTDVVTLVSSTGQVDERYSVEDKAKAAAFLLQVKKETELAKATADAGMMRPGGIGRPPMGMPPGGFRGRPGMRGMPGEMRGRGMYGPGANPEGPP